MKHRKLAIHGMIILAILTASFFHLPMLAFGWLGYAIFGIIKFIRYAVKARSSGIPAFVMAILASAVMLPILPLALIPSFVILVCHQNNNPEIIQNAPEYKFFHGTILRNASCFKSYSNTVIEGTIEEKELLKLAAKCSWELKPFSKEVEILPVSEYIRGHREKWDYSNPLNIKLQEGYETHYIMKNGGGYHLYWDRKSKWLHYRSSPR